MPTDAGCPSERRAQSNQHLVLMWRVKEMLVARVNMFSCLESRVVVVMIPLYVL